MKTVILAFVVLVFSRPLASETSAVSPGETVLEFIACLGAGDASGVAAFLEDEVGRKLVDSLDTGDGNPDWTGHATRTGDRDIEIATEDGAKLVRLHVEEERRIEVAKVTVFVDAAASSGPHHATFTLVSEGGRWRVSRLDDEEDGPIDIAALVRKELEERGLGRQRRTMADLRSIGTAVESYQVDNGFPPQVYGYQADVALLAPYLEPTFIKKIPEHDGWGNPILWESEGAGEAYSLISWGKDRSPDRDVVTGATTDFARDIYYANGQFATYPESRGD